MSLDQEDFQRLQTSLLELKNEKYSLEDQCRRQQHALGEATARVSVLEKELNQAQKIIAKSKKVTEVRELVRDNESLQIKLRSQEDDFRLQNQTLLQELTKLVTANEKLEEQIRKLHSADADEAVTVGLKDEISSLSAAKSLLVAERDTLRKENERLQQQLLSSDDPSSLGQQRLSPCSTESAHVVQMGSDGDAAVSFRKNTTPEHHTTLAEGLAHLAKIDQLEATVRSLKDENERIKRNTSGGSDDTVDWKSQCTALQEQVGQYQEKLRKKQESLVQIQAEKEVQYKELSQRMEALDRDRETETAALKEQQQRLQVQLNNGHTGFSEFKEKKVAEIQDLHETIRALSEKVDSCSPEKQAFVEAELSSLKGQIETLKRERDNLAKEREQLVAELQDLLAKSNRDVQEKSAIQTSLNETNDKLEEAMKTSENRKKLLDEMAIHVQKKSLESDESIGKLEKELALLTATLQEKDSELDANKEDVVKLEGKVNALQAKITELECHEAELDMDLNKSRVESSQKLSDLREATKDELKILKAEHEITLRDLRMQLEIANCQRSEFEDSVEQLKQEIKDMIEERKIGDKKGQALTKDLKRQLLLEKQRNEKLSEKMKEIFSEPSSVTSDNKVETDVDRTSNSSWSIYSGQNDQGMSRENVNVQQHLQTPSSMSSPMHHDPNNYVEEPRPSSLPNNSIDYSTEDYSAMLARIATLQDEKWSMEQRLQMLEHSASAMADDLVKKSTIIQHYCMEGKSDPPGKNSTSEKKMKNMKKVVDMLVHPEQADAQQKEELHRMQRMLEETLTKNMHLQIDMESLSQEVVRLSKLVPTTTKT